MPRHRHLGQVTIAILKAVAEGRRFGLDIIDGTGFPSGTVYPTLSRLEERGFITGRWESPRSAKAAGRPRRRYYRVTPTGRRELKAALARLGSLVSPAGRVSPDRA